MDKSIKNEGRVYTPAYIVKNILNLLNYTNQTILNKHVIDNSCGDGAFLVEVVDRYIIEMRKVNLSNKEMVTHLEQYIHGIEINSVEANKCRKNLDSLANKYGINYVNWDVLNEDALNVSKYLSKMDYVVGNPPYVRVHNLGNQYNNVKRFEFSQNGMTDLYIVFYEIGISMLNEKGKLGYITPNSLFNSQAARDLRSYLIKSKILEIVVDLGHFQAFDVLTYSAILILNKQNPHQMINFYNYDELNYNSNFVEKLDYQDIYIDNNFYFTNKNNLHVINNIYKEEYPKFIDVKNGFATLKDNFFIGNFDNMLEPNLLIPVLKGSTGKWYQCLFPYHNSELIPIEEIKKYPKTYDYMINNKEALIARSVEDKTKWYGFGRTQGINDVYKRKIALNSLVKSINDLKITILEPGTSVYSGLYIIGDIDFNIVINILKSESFMEYIKSLAKYKSGGYYTYSSADIRNFLNYNIHMLNKGK